MLSYDEFDDFCATLPATQRSVQWGGAHVWKVGEKVFAIGGWAKGDKPFVTFKCSTPSFEILTQLPGVKPAPYFASRGMKWVQVKSNESMSDDDICQYLQESHKLAAKNLTKRRQSELGLGD